MDTTVLNIINTIQTDFSSGDYQGALNEMAQLKQDDSSSQDQSYITDLQNQLNHLIFNRSNDVAHMAAQVDIETIRAHNS